MREDRGKMHQATCPEGKNNNNGTGGVRQLGLSSQNRDNEWKTYIWLHMFYT